MDKLRILMLISGLDIGGAHGGAERFGIELSRHLDRDSCDVTLCAFWQRKTRAEEHWQGVLSREDIPLIFASEWQGRFKLSEYYKGLQRLIGMYRPEPFDIIHSHYQMGTLAGLLLKTFGCTRKVIRTAHVSKEWGTGFASLLCRQVFTKWLYPIFLDAEVGVSQSIVNTLSKYPGNLLRRKTPYLIYNAIYPQAFEKREECGRDINLSFPKDRYLIGSIGRLTNQKGYAYLLDAVPLVLEQIPNAHFIIIGEGENRKILEQQARDLRVSEHVTFTGQQEQVMPLLRKMDIFVLPSLYEGFPTVLLESIASGVPVIATDIPGTNELIKHKENGWLVPPMNSQALAMAIIESFHHPEWREQFKRNALQTVDKYRIEHVANEYLQLYKKLIATSKLPR